jgi:hypothetical protein
MSFIAVIYTTPAMRTAACKLAPKLRELDVRQIPTQDKRIKLYHYEQEEIWGKEFKILLNKTRILVRAGLKYAFAIILTSKGK